MGGSKIKLVSCDWQREILENAPFSFVLILLLASPPRSTIYSRHALSAASAPGFPTSKRGVWMELYKFLDPEGCRHEVPDVLIYQGGLFARAHGIEHMNNLRRTNNLHSDEGWLALLERRLAAAAQGGDTLQGGLAASARRVASHGARFE